MLLWGERWPSSLWLSFSTGGGGGGGGGVLFADPPLQAHPSSRCGRNVSSLLCLCGVCLHLAAASKQADRSPHLHYKPDKQWDESCQTHRRTKEEDSVTKQKCQWSTTGLFTSTWCLLSTALVSTILVVTDINRTKVLKEGEIGSFLLFNFVRLAQKDIATRTQKNMRKMSEISLA